jgi:hypothetical protein
MICGLAFALTAALAPVRAQENASKPIALLAVSSYDELMQDADFLGGLLNMPQISQTVEGMLQGAKGLDRTKPLGLLVTQYGLPPTFAACVPVTDMKAFLESLAPVGVAIQDGGDGTTHVSAFNQTLYAKEANGWALVSMAPVMLEGMPADPGAEFAALTKDYDVALRFNLQNVPAEVRQQWGDLMGMAAQGAMVKNPDESDEAYAQRQKMMESQLATQKQMLNELDQLTFGVGVDRAGQKAIVDVLYTAVAGSELAKQVSAYKEATTNYAGFAQEGAAMTLNFAAKTTNMKPEDIDQLADNMRAQVNQGIAEESDLKSDESREKVKAAVGDFIEALRATLKAGAIDGGAVVNVSPEALTVVAGGVVTDPAKVEDGLKKLAEIAKSEEVDMPEVKWDAETYQDVKFHTLSHAGPEGDEAFKALFGEKLEMAVGLGKDSVYFAAGKNWMDGVKKVIDASAANKGKSIKPMELTVTATPIVETVAAHGDSDGKALCEAMAGALSQSSGRDHARVLIEPIENGGRWRVEVEDGLLRAIGTAVMAKQAQAAGAAPAAAN